MKRNKLIAAVFALVLAAAGASFCRAQEKERHYWQADFGLSFGMMDRSGMAFAASELRMTNYGDPYGTLASAHQPVFLPVFNLSAGYVMPERRLGIFMNTGVNYAYCDLEGGPSRLSERETILHVLPGVRIYYLQTPDLKMYASLGMGVRYRRYNELYKGDRSGYNDWQLSYLVSPFGVERGSHVFFSLDIAVWGSAYVPILVKVGYRF